MKNYFIISLILLFFSCNKNDTEKVVKLEGQALGTSFHITYLDKNSRDFSKQIDSLIHAVNKSLSTYLVSSDISRINKGDSTVLVDEMFQEVFQKSDKIFRETEGAFDPTIGVLVNAWGFGPGGEIDNLDSLNIQKLMEFVGFDKVKIKEGKVVKDHIETYLDFNANAKGFAVDMIGRFFESKKIQNYLVEIGGEIRAKGKNASNNYWKVAIEKPNFDGSRSFQTFLTLEDESIATSGNYRKFKTDKKTGKKYAHTIDTKTGYPTKSILLSASVIAKLDCADVDGYATALMAMGLGRSKFFLNDHTELKAFLIYSDTTGQINTFKTNNLVLQK
ncbi:MAG: FAD:protein FMN transferase [Bacteroidota bacterium]